ncbi:hypothetical protein [Flagellimonas eckloniae]|uniref:hypothetical protein n=1 Tax=Flagellimonas eckloniae TaxID=346185 RepID=UPI0006DBF741|nr:hypothetical protein [Allomuricauda eckloniae]
MQNFKQYIFSLLLILFAQIAFAKVINHCDTWHEKSIKPYCDLCGCATNNGNFGFGTLSNSNFIGFRYIHQSFESRDGIFSDSPSSNEYLNTYQLWTQVPVFQSFYITASLPYQDLKRTFESGSATESLKGIGDANVMGWYKLQFLKKQNNDSIPYPVGRPLSRHSIQIGIGAKLPTGEFEERLTNRVNPGFQVGTGSFDGIFSLGYNYGGDKIGFNALFTYYQKGENKNEYRFGNQWSYAGNLYYKLALNTFSLMPFVGISGDDYDTIKQFGETLQDTDGQILNGTFGAECTIGQFILGANASLPISQDLFGGNVQANERLSVYVNFSL